jgi:amicyanin
MKNKNFRGIVAATLALALMAAMVPRTAKAAEVEVKIDNFTFNPPRLTVKAGTTVTWENKDDIPHTATATKAQFKSKVLDTDEKFSFTFTTPGVYDYFCALHPHMTGTVVVEAATGSNAAQ